MRRESIPTEGKKTTPMETEQPEGPRRVVPREGDDRSKPSHLPSEAMSDAGNSMECGGKETEKHNDYGCQLSLYTHRMEKEPSSWTGKTRNEWEAGVR